MALYKTAILCPYRRDFNIKQTENLPITSVDVRTSKPTEKFYKRLLKFI